MAHKWDGKVVRDEEHTVTCTNCGVVVERASVDGRLKNFHTPKGGERTGGLAPKCSVTVVKATVVITEENENDKVTHPSVNDYGLSPKSLKLFKDIAEDMPNWSYCVPTDTNIQLTAEQRGNLTDLKKKGLIETDWMEDTAWITFTEAGEALSLELGIKEGVKPEGI